jgi:hypothetical protein
VAELTAEARARVERWTVSVGDNAGRGVMVVGHYVLTAAHIVDHDVEFAMIMGDQVTNTVTARDGTEFQMAPVFAETIADVAVLAEADDTRAADQLAAWCDQMERDGQPPALSRIPFPLREPVRVHVLDHGGNWTAATATRDADVPSGAVTVSFAGKIEAASCGGPIVDDDGRIVGLIGWTGTDDEDFEKSVGVLPVLRLALPAWLQRELYDQVAELPDG